MRFSSDLKHPDIILQDMLITQTVKSGKASVGILGSTVLPHEPTNGNYRCRIRIVNGTDIFFGVASEGASVARNFKYGG